MVRFASRHATSRPRERNVSRLQQLSVRANLEAELDGSPIFIRSDGDKMIVEFEKPKTAFKMLRLGLRRFFTRVQFAKVTSILNDMRSTVEVKVGSRVVATAGYGVENRFWTLLGFPGLSCSPVAAAVLVLRNR